MGIFCLPDDDYKRDNSILWYYCPHNGIRYISALHDWLVRGASERIGALCEIVATGSAPPSATFGALC